MKRSPDNVPGKFQERVFIGGNYDNIANLREIADFVKEAGFIPVLPYDDFDLPPDQIHDWDLRLLHYCKYAVFDVNQPAGELMEIERTRDYGVKTLLVHQARKKGTEEDQLPPRVRTMLMQSGPHETKAYERVSEIKEIVKDFLVQKDATLFNLSVGTFGYKFSSISVADTLHEDNIAQHEYHYDGLQVSEHSAINLTELTHDISFTHGRIQPNSFRFTCSGASSATWIPEEGKSSDRAVVGVVRLVKPLRAKDPPFSYAIELKSEKAFALNKHILDYLIGSLRDDPLLEAGYEYTELSATYPCEVLKLSIQFFNGYDVTPEIAAFHGTEKRADAITIPPDEFTFENNRAELVVRRPKIFHRYDIYWKVPETSS